MSTFHFRLTLVALVALAVSTLSGCGGNAQAVNDSSQNLKELSTAILKYHEDNEKWPDALADLKPVIGTDYAGAKIGGGKDYAALVKNPATGADPGYEYVKPSEKPDSYEKTVVLYQLRDGKRDETLKAGYLDGSVRAIGE
jgi:outer membrane murein-binding lipoprotein Lpp